ncbi:MAG: hypothetical protein A3A28_05040 [Candidatus Sungbacteria bacterium RIFCSPLOWO2_01_FULL_47_32]|uniref:Right handed beta helix domain-containing protein n=1 Tax=Candidatus Sungbacteria bacterium RIFCSPHIGHO2_01_FULL_47_32 TaxID=1802264 RepID=A0A1G2K5B0_9BACT|nr:MAG: hypothetical protein A2633_01265 [Candidatus Sungbacteria bacterium RIFCSPHIGHO2_01_FULL_47_32]OGZ99522.1 MAG: hypothetical protein A3D57_00690 [Candidatus Sungbacteria bacterium RIFCSPHIGHO2_02_FULL_46_12]OHA04841.1 MAG: hypothetical protein A3A28_05040 [Candidatus Sungbacteria bacterium RIFCSPLOWO2_01_FULL_47_32]
MENSRNVKILTGVIGGGVLFLSIPLFIYAYDNKTTHPALTQEIGRFYSASFNENKLTAEDIMLLMQGSDDEDVGTRPLRHFYDPVHDDGLHISGVDWESSKEWASDTVSQAAYDEKRPASLYGATLPLFSSDTDFSWERAVYEYAWKDKKRGLVTLGHILHLVEDATVPDHTRNDPHPPFLYLGSPYEGWAEKFNPETIHTADSLISSGQRPSVLTSIDSYFDNTANYSNNNFFSKDTILIAKYSAPTVTHYGTEVDSNGMLTKFGFEKKENVDIHLVKTPLLPDWKLILGSDTDQYEIVDKDYRILTDYWNLLSQKAVINGAGVVKLFFDEVEKEKQTKTLWKKNRTWFGKAWDWTTDTISSFWSSPPLDTVKTDTQYAGLLTAISGQNSPDPTSHDNPPEIGQNEPQTGSSSPTEGVEAASGGQVLGLSTTASNQLNFGTTTTEVQSGLRITGFLSGGLGAFTPPEGVGPSLADMPSENSQVSTSTSTTTPPAPEPDTTPPDVLLTIEECVQSFSSEGCLVPASTLHMELSSVSSDIESYSLSCKTKKRPSDAWLSCDNFSYDGHATSSVLTATEGLYELTAQAQDIAGNESPESLKDVEVNSSPVVLNEVAWAGMGNSATTSKDVWVELYNRSYSAVNLSEWSLSFLRPASLDIALKAELHGTIPGRSFFLIEGETDDVLPDILADEVTLLLEGILAGGTIVSLEKNGTTFDRTPLGCYGWCAGYAPARSTMERIDPDSEGGNASNWGTYYEEDIARTHTSREGEEVFGTPKARNSLNFLVAPTGVLEADKTLAKENSPYVVNRSGLIVPDGKLLTLGPGVVIKIISAGSPEVTVRGKLISQGTVAEPVVVTSIFDDEYGGDTNKDGLCSPSDASSTARCPVPGSWARINVARGGIGELAGTIIRFGGGISPGPFGRNASILCDGANIGISDSTVEYSAGIGTSYILCQGNILGSLFRHNGLQPVLIGGGSVAVSGNHFEHNAVGMSISESPHSSIVNNEFLEDTYAVEVINTPPAFSSNKILDGSAGIKGVILKGYSTENYSFMADMPYIVESAYTFSDGLFASIGKGTIFKFMENSELAIAGSLTVSGDSENPIVFTSISDDEFGGDTNANGASTTPTLGDWRGISITGSGNSLFDGATVRFAGGRFQQYNGAGIKVEGAEATIKNSVIEKNKNRGVWFKGTNPGMISDTIFRDHKDETGENYMALLFSGGASTTLQNLVFRNNGTAVLSDESVSLTNNGGIDIDASNDIATVPPGLFP